MRSARIGLLTMIAGAVLTLAACETAEPGVKTSGFRQFTTLEATTADTTKAATSVLEDLGLHDIASSSTNLDGWATGTMADKTPVKVTVKYIGEKDSDISVAVGSFGDEKLGKDIIARVRKELGIEPPPAPTAHVK